MNEMIYLDNSATTKVNPQVMETYVRANDNFWGNSSSLHNFGAASEQLLFQSSRKILDLLTAKNHQVIFTSGATESNNLALKGVIANHQGAHLITTKIEHPSVSEVCDELKKQGIRISYLDVRQSSEAIVNQLETLIEKDTLLVSCMQVNNEMGLVLPIKEMGALLSNYPRIKFHVDAVQSVGKFPLDLEAFKIDLLSISAHKIHGIKGVGALIARLGMPLKCQIAGGGQMNGLRCGTVNVAGAASLAKALRLQIVDQAEKFKKISRLFNYTSQKLEAIPGVVVNSKFANQSPYIINFWVRDVRGETLVYALSEHGIYISAKSACSSKVKQASPVLLALGFTNQVAVESLRISFANDSTLAEVDQFLASLQIEIAKLTAPGSGR